MKALLDDQFCRLREKEILSGGHFVCHAWSFRSNVVIACPFQKYFLGSMSKSSVDHTALDVPFNKFQKLVIGVFMLHFCHNFNFLISKNRVYTIAYQTLPFVEMEKWVKKPQKWPLCCKKINFKCKTKIPKALPRAISAKITFFFRLFMCPGEKMD